MSQRYTPRPDDGWDETRETIDGFTHLEASFYPGRYSENYTYPVRYEGPSQESFEHMEPSRSYADVIDLARSAVESGREETQRSLAGTEGVSEAVELKLTIDLGHQHIQDIPSEVVSVIKDEVARYVCSHPAALQNNTASLSVFPVWRRVGYCSADPRTGFPCHIIRSGIFHISSPNVPSSHTSISGTIF